MKKFLPIFTALAMTAALLTACGGNDNKATTMQLTKAKGQAWVYDEKEQDLKIIENLSLFSGYQVGTKEAANAWIALDKAKLVKMDEDSQLEITRSDDEKHLEIDLQSGKLYFNVTEPLEDDETFDIRMSTMTVGIRGTAGWVESFEDYSRIVLLEGEVTLTALNGSSMILLSEGYMATLPVDAYTFTIEPLPIQEIPEFVRDEEETTLMIETLAMTLGDVLDEANANNDSTDSESPYDPKEGIELPDVPDDGIARQLIAVASDQNLDELFDGSRDLSNTEIRLFDGDYTSDYGLFLSSYENLSIIGTGKTRIVVNNGSDTVLRASQTKNLLLYGLVLGHDIPTEDVCSQGVLTFYECENTNIVGCDIFGCGLFGISGSGNITLTNSVIRDCSYAAVDSYYECTFHFIDSIIQGNEGPYLFSGNDTTQYIFDDCFIQNNLSHNEFVPSVEGKVTKNNTVTEGNGWQ